MAQPGDKGLPTPGVINDIRPVETGAKHGSICNLPTISACDTALFHVCHRIVMQYVINVFDRQGRAAGKPDTRMVAAAHVTVDTKLLCDRACPVGERGSL